MSKFLMGALVVLTMGVFSSCKDYDDDINANTALIKDLQSQVDKLEQAKSALQTDLATANSAIAAAQAAADKAAADLIKAKQDLQDAINAAQQAAIDEAQKRIDTAEANAKAYALEVAKQEAAAAAAAAKIEILEKLENDVNTLNAAIAANGNKIADIEAVIATLASKEEMNNALAPILADVAALQNLMATKADKSTVEAIDARLTEIYNNYVKKGDFESLKTAVAALEARIAAVEPALATVTTLANSNQERISINEGAIAALQQTLNQIQINYATIEYVDSKITALNDELSEEMAKMALKSELQELQVLLENAISQKADQSALDAALAAIAEIKANYATKSELTAALEELNAKLAKAATKEELADAQQALQNQINDLGVNIGALENTLRALIETKIAALNNELLGKIGALETKVDNNNTTLLGIIENLSKKYDGQFAELSGAMAGINSAMNGLSNRIGSVESELAGMAAELNKLAAELGALENFDIEGEEGGAVSSLSVGATASSGIDALVKLLKTMSEKIENIHAYVDQALAGVQTEIDNITLLITKNLTSLVYRPEVDVVGDDSDVAYLYGFPVIRAILLQPQEVFTFTYTADNDVVKSSGSVSKQFDIVAKYWLNPSSTDITKYNWTFDEVAGKNLITRGNQDTKKAGVSANVLGVDKNGVLSVALKLNDGSNVNDAKTYTDTETGSQYSWITTVALQAIRNDADVASKDTVTSDYAIIVPAYYKDLLLANNDYKKDTHVEGNQEFHLRTVYSELKAENATGVFSYEMAYNDEKAEVDLTSIDIHFNDGQADHGVMSHKDAQDRGFTFKYTILTDKDYFALDNDNEKITVAKKENTSVGKVANVRVELQADGKTFAYGYISIIITSPKVTVNIDMPDLVIKCPDPVATSLKWADVKKKIEDAIGVPGSFDNYNWVNEASNINKFQPNTDKADNKKGIISQDANNFSWTFTEAEIYEVFYTTGAQKPAPKEYKTSIHLTPKDGHPELADVVVNVTIKNEIYPTGEFSYTQRIQQYWFNKESTKIAETAEERYEIHGNVEVVAQPDADDEFFFNVAASFFNSKFGQTGYEDPDAILIYDTHKFNYADLATVYFDAEKYYIYNAADANKTIAQMKSVAPATSFAKGMSGAEYLLYIADRDSKVLMAVKDKLVEADAQPVVVLSGTYNNIVTYQGWTYFDGSNKDDFAFAYDLLNKNDHNEVAAGETFTTHMMLDQRDYCFPIDFSQNESFKFDIRYLRPISVDEQENHDILDAKDAGTTIYLAEHAGFIDWRDIKFSAKLRLNYVNYYGIRAIKPNLDKAVTDINGGWTNIKYFPLLQFEDLTTEGSGTYTDAADFINQLGFVKYTNNGLNVGTFTIKMPITLLYDWGETAEQWITFTIYRTQGQDINARQK